MKIRKRNGIEQEFDLSKIENAVKKANATVSKENKLNEADVNKVLQFVISNLPKEENVDIEIIQDLVEKGLMNENFFEVAKSYILYREERAKERFKKLSIVKEIKEKLEASNPKNQNANLDEKSFGGRKGEADSALLKQMALDYYMSPKAAKNHINNRIYTHDLDSFVIGDHNCIDESSWIKVVIDDVPKTMKLSDLGKILGIENGGSSNVENLNIQILSRDGYTLLKNVWARETDSEEEVFEIKTKRGLPLIATADHRLPVLRDGKEIVLKVKDIKEGDSLIEANTKLSSNDYRESFINLLDIEDVDMRIANSEKLYRYLLYKYDVFYSRFAKENNLSNAHNVMGQNMSTSDLKKIMDNFALDWDLLTSLRVKASGSKKSYPLFIPFSESLAKLYAYIYADGGVYVNEAESLFQLTFTNTNEEIMDDFIKCYKEVFGYSLNKSYPAPFHTSPCIRVTDGSRIIVRLFKDFAGARKYGAADISVPDFVLNGTDEIKYAYLSAAMDTDGCFSKNILYTTCGERYSEQFCMILRSLGYSPVKRLINKKGSIYKFGTHTGMRNFDCYTVVLNRVEDKADFAEKTYTLKFSDKYAYNGFSKNFCDNEIVKISRVYDKRTVYDLETESHWFIVNNYISHNCLSCPIDELLANGFKTRQVFIRPAGSVNTAFQLVAVIFQLQSLQQFGGVAATHIDWSLAPYVRKSFMKHYIVAYLKDTDEFDKLDLPQMMFEDYQDESGIWRNKLEDWIEENKQTFFDKLNLKQEDFYFDNKSLDPKYRQSAVFDTIQEVKQGAEGMLHNLNSLQSRSGNQLPFSSINYGTCTQEEGRIITRAILSATIKGVGNNQTSIFPCQIFQKMKGVNDKGNKNYDLYQLAIRSTAKRMYPNYVNCDWSKDQGYNKDDPRTYPSTMGCRTYSSWDINAPDEAHKHMKDGRGNIAPATIILPTLAMEAKKKSKDNPSEIVDCFMKILDTAIEDCKDGLIERFNWICAQSPDSAKFMYENHTFYSYGDEFEKEGIRGALKHGTLAIGQIGMAETLQILIGTDQTTEAGMKLAKQIEQLFSDRCKEYKEKYRLNFGNYYAPAENLSYTSMQKFQKKYGLIENVSAKMENGKLVPRNYFTNSIHVPVWKEVTPFEKIDIESQLTGYSSAGCITYVEIGDNAQNNLAALEQIVDYAMAKDIPYFALNVRFSDCTKCGYSGYIDYKSPCPKCGADHEYINDYARITGYLSTKVAHFNKGKQEEAGDRYVHVNKLNSWKK